MMECPNGCTHPAGAMRIEEERIELPTPKVVDTPNGEILVETEKERFLECRVCGWCVDI